MTRGEVIDLHNKFRLKDRVLIVEAVLKSQAALATYIVPGSGVTDAEVISELL